MSTTPAPASFSVETTWGALYISAVLETALWAAASVQVYYYYNEYKKDVWTLKLLVAIVWALDTIHLIFEVMKPYFVLVTHYGDPFYLTASVSITNIGDIFVVLSGLIILFVQGFYVHRIWQLSKKNYYLLAPLVVLLGAEFGANTTLFARVHPMDSVLEWAEVRPLAIAIDVLDAVTSVIIAGLVIFFLQRSRTGFRRTETMINRLIMWTVNTGLLTSLCALASLIFVIVQPDNFIYILFFGLTPKLYTNSLLATLNVRNKAKAPPSNDSGNSDSSISFSHILERRNRNNNNQPITINIEKDMCTMNDVESARTGKD